MKKILFGFNQIKQETPAFAKWVFRVVLYAAAIGTLVVNTIPEIPDHTADLIAKYSLYAITLTHSISKMFGIKVEDNESNAYTL